MPMKISIDPVVASRIQDAWDQLGRSRPDLQAKITAAMQSAHAQAVTVTQTGTPPLSAGPHSLTLAHSALTNDCDGVIDGLQAGILIGVGPDGVMWGTGKWQQLDPGWIEAFAVYLENLVVGNRPFTNTPQTIRIPNTVKIAMAGDWGTGEWRTQTNPAPSTRVRKQMIALNPDVTIHLGDVYYAGTDDQEQHLLVKLWPPAPSGSFALNSNHEMYSGGGSYFKALSQPPFDKQAGCSYFALENDDWVIVGLDSAHFSPEDNLYVNGLLFNLGYPNEQNSFLLEKSVLAAQDNKRVIVLTHHNSLDDAGATTNPLFGQVIDAFPGNTGPAYWYYGHSHIAAVYKPKGGVLCRCCGHGALPWGHASVLANSPNVAWYEDRKAGDPDMPQRLFNGFAMITLDGPNIQEAFYDENGGIAWSS